MIVDGDHNVVVVVGNVDDILVYENVDNDYNDKYEIVKLLTYENDNSGFARICATTRRIARSSQARF